jgi:hypothetical protein
MVAPLISSLCAMEGGGVVGEDAIRLGRISTFIKAERAVIPPGINDEENESSLRYLLTQTKNAVGMINFIEEQKWSGLGLESMLDMIHGLKYKESNWSLFAFLIEKNRDLLSSDRKNLGSLIATFSSYVSADDSLEFLINSMCGIIRDNGWACTDRMNVSTLLDMLSFFGKDFFEFSDAGKMCFPEELKGWINEKLLRDDGSKAQIHGVLKGFLETDRERRSRIIRVIENFNLLRDDRENAASVVQALKAMTAHEVPISLFTLFSVIANLDSLRDILPNSCILMGDSGPLTLVVPIRKWLGENYTLSAVNLDALFPPVVPAEAAVAGAGETRISPHLITGEGILDYMRNFFHDPKRFAVCMLDFASNIRFRLSLPEDSKERYEPIYGFLQKAMDDIFRVRIVRDDAMEKLFFHRINIEDFVRKLEERGFSFNRHEA